MDMQHSYPITHFLRTLLQSAAPGGRSDGLSVAVTRFSDTSNVRINTAIIIPGRHGLYLIQPAPNASG